MARGRFSRRSQLASSLDREWFVFDSKCEHFEDFLAASGIDEFTESVKLVAVNGALIGDQDAAEVNRVLLFPDEFTIGRDQRRGSEKVSGVFDGA